MTKDYKTILDEAYEKARTEMIKDKGKSFIESLEFNQQSWIKTVANGTESLKAVTTALTTSLVKKIEDPKQDVRYHKSVLEGGYSGRTLDTNYVTPFFKQKFRRIAMKESGWLTRSIEQPQPFTLDFQGKIRNEQTKNSFLRILNDIEEKKVDPEKYLVALFILLIKITILENNMIQPTKVHNNIPINIIIERLTNHFSHKYCVSGASKLPVIALYSIYEMLITDVVRYHGKKLLPLKSHIAADSRARGIGDIEIVDENGNYFEAIEIKHGISINTVIIKDAFEKFKGTPIKRYYFLTTAEPNIKSGEELEIRKLVAQIREEHGCEVIGVLLRKLSPGAEFFDSCHP